MKYFNKIAFAIVLILFGIGCSDSTSPTIDPKVDVVGELTTPFVNIIKSNINDDNIQANEVDSIRIIRIRILMSRMKLFLDGEDPNGGKAIQTEPFVYDINTTTGVFLVADGTVPIGSYERIKFEFHRFSASEALVFANDAILKDFATPERYSILIEGISYKEGNPATFTFRSQTTANLSLKFEPSLNLKNDSKTTILLQIDPTFFFKKWESILDPNDPKNINDIENTLINTIKAVKK